MVLLEGGMGAATVLRSAICSLHCNNVHTTSCVWKLCFWDSEWSCAWFPFFAPQRTNGRHHRRILPSLIFFSLSAYGCRVHNLLFRSFRHWLQPPECVNPCKPRMHTRLGACTVMEQGHTVTWAQIEKRMDGDSILRGIRAIIYTCSPAFPSHRGHHHPNSRLIETLFGTGTCRDASTEQKLARA